MITTDAWQDYEQKQARAVALEKVLATRKVNFALMNSALPELAAELGSVAGQTYAQLLKRPEVTVERLLPILRPEWDETSPLAFFGGTVNARVRNELKSVETEIKFGRVS